MVSLVKMLYSDLDQFGFAAATAAAAAAAMGLALGDSGDKLEQSLCKQFLGHQATNSLTLCFLIGSFYIPVLLFFWRKQGSLMKLRETTEF